MEGIKPTIHLLMEALNIAESAETPNINLDAATNTFQITGRSLSDKPGEFYRPVIEWLTTYSKTPNPETVLIFKFEYLNTESSKSILDILTVAEKISGAKVNWFFNEDDEDMEEIGEEISELVNIPFDFKHY
jgi:hypothetical protein